MANLQVLIRQSVAVFFALAVFCFVMIFLLSAALSHKSANNTDDNVPIQQDEVATWGQIPGELQVEVKGSLNLYGFNYNITDTASDIAMTKTDTISYSGERAFTDVFWYPQKSVVSYGLDNNVTLNNDIQTEWGTQATVFYPNLGAVDTWEQMKEKPKFLQAWEAINEASDLLFTAEMLNNFYSYNALNYIFNDYEQVQKYVLVGLTDPTQQNTVYTDPNFGMNTVKGLSWWVSADLNGDTSRDYQILVTYFASKGITLDDTVMEYILGPKAMLTMITNTLSQQVRTDPNLYQTSGSINLKEIAQGQWGNCGVIYDNMMVGLPTTYSYAKMDPVIAYPPEFGAYVLDPERGGGNQSQAFNISMSKILLEQDPTSYKSFLNSANLQYFYEQYEVNEYEALLERFGFQDNHQIVMFANYMDELIDYFLYQYSTSDKMEMGTLLNKEVNATFGYLQATLPLTLASRVVDANIELTDYGASDPCTYYVQQSGISDPAPICAAVDFMNPNEILIFMNVTWFPDDTTYYDNMIAMTGFTSAQWTAFMDTSVDTTFGYLVQNSLVQIATTYNCYGGTNCTAVELAGIQYGNSGVTNTPVIASDTYLPQTDSVITWGSADWLPYGQMTRNPEFPFISQDPDALTISSEVAVKLGQANTTFYGLGSKYMCQTLMIAYYNQNTSVLDSFTTWWGTDFDLDNYLVSLRMDIQNRFFGDSYIDYTAEDLLFGFYSEAANNLNGGDYYNGNFFGLRNFSTPIFHDINGLGNQTVYGMYTGANDLDKIGYLRLINNYAAINKLATIWNGYEYVTEAILRPLSTNQTMNDIALADVSYGMQFPPNMGKDSIKTFDEMAMNIDTYDYDSETTVGDSDLKLYKYKSSAWSGLLLFSNSLPLYEEAMGCYGCQTSAQESRTLKVNDTVVQKATEEPDNFMTVQPDTGYTYSKEKQSTVYFVLGQKQEEETNYKYIPSPFPALDPIYGIPVPLYDMNITLSANEQVFTDKFSYVASGERSTRAIIITFSVFAGIFLILGIVALVMSRLTGGRSNSKDELLEQHMDRD